MPNWTSNHISAEGEAADIRAFLEAVKWEDKIFDFNRLIPMPELLKRTGSGFRTIDGKNVESWIEDEDSKGKAVARCFTSEEHRELEQIGYSNWYDWAVANWGTKWNACHIDILDSSEYGYAEISFDTAWDAPVPVLLKMREMFPKLTFNCEWRHEDESAFPHSLDDVA
jgi:hypothetical protein